jgi:hypothetical protein
MLNSDDYPEILVGNYSGGFTLYKGVWPPSGVDVLGASDIILVPNPATSSVRVVNKGNRKLSGDAMIYNAEGEMLFTTNIDSDGFLNDISVLSPGLYFISLLFDDGLTGNSKLVIIR